MSLQLAAQHLASRGRGPDTQLVHMAPQEVAGLHALAKSHGGALTTNPDTGLPEAGFLSSILPMVIGAGITAATGGAAAPWMIGLGVGGAQTLATGSLQKGLMAGLGAYGGAGLAGGLMGAGAAGAAGTAMAPQTAAQLGTGFEAAMAAQGAAPTIGATGASMGAQTAAQLGSGFQADMAAQGLQPSAIQAQQAVQAAAPQTVTQAPTFTENLSQMGRGVSNLGTEAGREAFMSKEGVGGGMGLAKYGLAGLAPMMFQEPERGPEQEKLKPYKYDFSYNPVADVNQGYTGAYTGERTHFNPVYTRTAAGGGLMDINPIGAMSQQNQSQMQPAYAQGGVSDMAINPYTGSETFDKGGDTTAVKPVEQDPYYTMTGQSGDMFKYLMGQGARPAAPAPMAAPAANSTGATGFLKGITGFASPAGTVDITTGQLTPWSASNPAPTGSFFGGPGTAAAPASGARLGSSFSAAPRTDGEYVDDASGTKSYTFDPTTGGFTSVAPPKVFRPFTANTMDSVNTVGAGMGMSDIAQESKGLAQGGIAALAQGGQSHLGDYSDGGRLLRGPGDGVSDSIPASIGDKRPARLADGEFVVPARIVSELGNGSTEAGARKLYAMMDRVQKARAKTTGKDRVATNTKAEKLLPV